MADSEDGVVGSLVRRVDWGANDGATVRPDDLRTHLLAGQALPAHPLALDENRKLDERHQRALTRYYIASGAGGIAVGVHTTQFAIRESGMYRPVLELAAATARDSLATNPRPFALVSGICGRTDQAVAEAETAVGLGYDAGLLSPGAWRDDDEESLLSHCRAVADVIPLFGFYLQPAVGGRVLSYAFWRRILEIPRVVAIKIAPFNRYQTLDVARALAESGRKDVALYTGNDDNILIDLMTPLWFKVDGTDVAVTVVGGLLGHWAVWTKRAVDTLDWIKAARRDGVGHGAEWLSRAASTTDANGALFDSANGFRGCIAGIHEVLRRQGLMRGSWCLDPNEMLSPGQSEEIDRVLSAYPWMTDDAFVAEHLDEWLNE